ncbi:MAG: 4-diphosphocytidyl-2C-methyl-D-erythritol kinase, partial [Alphaproteobacteria bacterium]
MKFGSIPLAEAEGAILAHSQRVGERKLKKGQVLSATHVAALAKAGYTAVVAARLDPSDMGENDAAARVADAVAGVNVAPSPASTGRCNLYAERRGLAVVDPARVDRLNGVSEALTIATLPPFELVEAGQMVATVKVITFGLDSHVVEAGAQIAREDSPLVRVASFLPAAVGLIQTRLPG